MDVLDEALTKSFVIDPVAAWKTLAPLQTRDDALKDALVIINNHYLDLHRQNPVLSRTDRAIIDRDKDEMIRWAKEVTSWYFLPIDKPFAGQLRRLAALVWDEKVEIDDNKRREMWGLVQVLEHRTDLGYTKVLINRAKLIQLRVAAGAPRLDGPRFTP